MVSTDEHNILINFLFHCCKRHVIAGVFLRIFSSVFLCDFLLLLLVFILHCVFFAYIYILHHTNERQTYSSGNRLFNMIFSVPTGTINIWNWCICNVGVTIWRYEYGLQIQYKRAMHQPNRWFYTKFDCMSIFKLVGRELLHCFSFAVPCSVRFAFVQVRIELIYAARNNHM